MANPEPPVDPGFPELEALAHADEGLYYVALHSFIAGFRVSPDQPAAAQAASRDSGGSSGGTAPRHLGAQLDQLSARLEREGRLTAEARSVIGTFRASCRLAEAVEAGRDTVTREEVAAATHTFLRWCELVGFERSALQHIRRGLAIWSGYPDRGDTNGRGDGVESRHAGEGGDAEDATAASNDTTADPEAERRRFRERMRALRDRPDGHLDYLTRYTAYTRSRADFARTVMSLSAEQREILDRITERGDFLISGPPGSGKTVVLLHAFDRFLGVRDQELGFSGDDPVILLTYTRTLVRFSEYLSRILGRHRVTPIISTVDAFLLSRVREVREDGYIVFPGRAVAEFSAQLERAVGALRERGVTEISAETLWTEIDREIFAEDRDHREYMNAQSEILPLPPESEPREIVWSCAEAIIAEMAERGGYSRSRVPAVLFPEGDTGAPACTPVDRIFVDEAQDLAPRDLSLLSRLSRKGLVVAGDDLQRIYRAGASFQEAGLSVKGRSRTLHHNHRNTGAIWGLARRYAGDQSPQSEVTSLRDGPDPEFFVGGDRQDAMERACEEARFFVERLSYDPEQISILVPGNDEIRDLLQVCRTRTLLLSNVKSRGFDFDSTAGVRISTMHSAKGVEYPVAIVVLTGFARREDLDGAQQERMERNLIYVAATRAMDHLRVIVPAPIEHRSIRDFVSLAEDQGAVTKT